MTSIIRKNTLLFLSLIVWLSCQSSENKLPILGEREPVTRQVNGENVTDTLYHTIPDFAFLNQDSTWVTPKTFEGKIYVADFFFTTCPTICPVMKTQMLRVYEKFKDNPQVLLLSHSIDPKHDSVAVLREFAARLGVDSRKWHFVTGDKEEIYKIGQQEYMVTATEDPTAPGGILHSGAFILVDKDRRIRGIYDGTQEKQVDRLMQDIEKLIGEDERS